MADDDEVLPAEEDTKWANSEAKRVLREDILMGRVKKEMKPKQVHESRAVFLEWPLSKFRSNLSNLRQSIARDYSRMLTDCECYGHDISALVELRKKHPFKEKQWHLSEAKPLLEQDVKDQRHEGLKPSQVHGLRPECLAFSPDKFRSHLCQEIKRQAGMEAKIRFRKKKLRAAPLVPVKELIDMIDHHDGKAPKKEKKRKVDPVAAAKKQRKREEINQLPVKRRARVSRKI